MDFRNPREILRTITSSRSNLLMAVLAILIILLGSYAITGYLIGNGGGNGNGNGNGNGSNGITTFTDTGSAVCTEDGKPVIRLFSTTRCPHCIWVKDTFDSVTKEYVDKGLIVAHHWELDTGDDTLTEEVEDSVPDEEMSIYSSFSGGYVPAYSMGCRYTRVGNGHEPDLEAEEAELRAAIEKLIADSS